MRSPVANSLFASRKTLTPRKPARVVAGAGPVFTFHGEGVGTRVHTPHPRKTVPLDSKFFTACRVLENISSFIASCPSPFRTRHIRAMGKRLKLLPVCGKSSFLQQLTAHGLVDMLAAAIVGRNDDGVLRFSGIVPSDGGNAVCSSSDLCNSTLLRKQRDSLLRFVVCQVLNRLEQLGVFLPHNSIQLRSLHPGILHLLKRPTCFYTLVLADVSNHQNAVVWIQFVEERTHLLCAGKARLIEHVEMPVGRIGAGMVFASREEALGV